MRGAVSRPYPDLTLRLPRGAFRDPRAGVRARAAAARYACRVRRWESGGGGGARPTREGSPGTTRRHFLKTTAVGAARLAVPASGAAAAGARAAPPAAAGAPVPAAGRPRFFSDAERDVLAGLAERVLPGAGTWGAVDYVEGLLTAFEVDPPRLFAGTLGSGEPFLELDRVQAHAWRLRLYGSDDVAYPNRAVLGPVRGLRPLLREGAERAARLAAAGSGPDAVWSALPEEFTDAFTGLVLEGSLGDPIYGGNRDAAGWDAHHFEGTLLAYGSTSPPHATREGHAGAAEPPADDAEADGLHWSTRIALWGIGFFSRWIAR